MRGAILTAFIDASKCILQRGRVSAQKLHPASTHQAYYGRLAADVSAWLNTSQAGVTDIINIFNPNTQKNEGTFASSVLR